MRKRREERTRAETKEEEEKKSVGLDSSSPSLQMGVQEVESVRWKREGGRERVKE